MEQAILAALAAQGITLESLPEAVLTAISQEITSRVSAEKTKLYGNRGRNSNDPSSASGQVDDAAINAMVQQAIQQALPAVTAPTTPAPAPTTTPPAATTPDQGSIQEMVAKLVAEHVNNALGTINQAVTTKLAALDQVTVGTYIQQKIAQHGDAIIPELLASAKTVAEVDAAIATSLQVAARFRGPEYTAPEGVNSVQTPAAPQTPAPATPAVPAPPAPSVPPVANTGLGAPVGLPTVVIPPAPTRVEMPSAQGPNIVAELSTMTEEQYAEHRKRILADVANNYK